MVVYVFDDFPKKSYHDFDRVYVHFWGHQEMKTGKCDNKTVRTITWQAKICFRLPKAAFKPTKCATMPNKVMITICNEFVVETSQNKWLDVALFFTNRQLKG